MRLPRRLVGLALIRVTSLGIQLPLLSGVRSDPLALAQGVPYPNPVLLECPVLCTARPFTGTILRLPHRLRALCFRLTVRVPPLGVTLSICPLYHRAVPAMVPYVVMDTHILSAVFLRRLILSVSQTVITLKMNPHLPIAAHTMHAVYWFALWGKGSSR